METLKVDLQIPIDVTDVSKKSAEMENRGFENYLTTFEKWTVYDDANMHHICLVNNTTHESCDIYYNDNRAFMVISQDTPW